MKRIIIALLFLCISALGTVRAQGLKGAPSCPRGASQSTPLIKGKSDSERWSNFQAVQPSLIGMTHQQVIDALGQGKAFIKSDELTLRPRIKKDSSCLLYEIAEIKIPGKPGRKAPVELTIVFKENVVRSYSIEALY